MVQKGGDRKGSLECKSVEGNGILDVKDGNKGMDD